MGFFKKQSETKVDEGIITIILINNSLSFSLTANKFEVHWGDGVINEETKHCYSDEKRHVVLIKGEGITEFCIKEYYNIQSVMFTDCHFLYKLRIHNNNIEYLNLNDCVDLEEVFCSNNVLNTIRVDKLDSLITFVCKNNFLDSLTIKSENLTYLDCSNNELTTLVLKRCFRLSHINCSRNSLNWKQVINQLCTKSDIPLRKFVIEGELEEYMKMLKKKNWIPTI